MVFLFMLGALVVATSTAGTAQDPTYGQRKAYEYAMRCFVVGGLSMPDKAQDPTGALTSPIREKARKAYDTAFLMGAKLGYSKAKISDDFDGAQGAEMRLMMANPGYMARARADCVRIGLM